MWQLAVIILCLFFNAMLAAAELSFASINKPYLRELAKKGSPQAQRVLKLKENPERTLSVLQVGTTFVGVVAAAIGGAAVDEWLSPMFTTYLHVNKAVAEILSIFLFVIPYTYINVVGSELLPKSLALYDPKTVIFRSSLWMTWLSKILFPVVYILEQSTKWGLRTFFSRFRKERHKEEERMDLSLVGQELHPYLLNLVGIEDKWLKDAMIPWETMITLDWEKTQDQVKKIVIESGHTRIPVVKEGKVVGILHTKEFMALLHTEQSNWHEIVRETPTFQETDPLIKVLKAMQEKASHMSIVYQSEKIVGIITIEDILEEIVGEIYDEDDDGKIKQIIHNRSLRKKF